TITFTNGTLGLCTARGITPHAQWQDRSPGTAHTRFEPSYPGLRRGQYSPARNGSSKLVASSGSRADEHPRELLCPGWSFPARDAGDRSPTHDLARRIVSAQLF